MIEQLICHHKKVMINLYLAELEYKTPQKTLRSHLKLDVMRRMVSHRIVPKTTDILKKYILDNGLYYRDAEDLYDD